MPLPHIAVTMGDPAGVGPEICLRLLENADLTRECVPIIFGSADVLKRVSKVTGIPFTARILSPDQWKAECGQLSCP